MNLDLADIRPTYDEAKAAGATHLLVFRNARSGDLELVRVMPHQSPKAMISRYGDNRTVVHVRTINVSEDLESQL